MEETLGVETVEVSRRLQNRLEGRTKVSTR